MKQIALIAAALAFAAVPVRAGAIDIVLTQSYVYANPGDTVGFDATVTAPWPSPYDTVFLNADTANVDNPLALDDSPFFLNFPSYMYPGDPPAQGTLFAVFVPFGTAQGVYSGSFTILGGADGSTLDPLATAIFNVEVLQGSAEVPEPCSLAAVAGALLMLGARLRQGFN